MAKQQNAWMPKPATTSKTAIPAAIKLELETKAANLIETVLKPMHVLPQKADIRFNYVSDIGTKWYRNYFDICQRIDTPSNHRRIRKIKIAIKIREGSNISMAETQKALATKSERGLESYRENRTACYRKSTLGRISDARSGQILHQPRYSKPSDEE